MAARANALGRGFSGIRPEVVELLVTALNRDILPEIPSEGSVRCQRRPRAARAHGAFFSSASATFAPVKNVCPPPMRSSKTVCIRHVQCKEGLALVNGTSAMTGLAALATHEAAQS